MKIDLPALEAANKIKQFCELLHKLNKTIDNFTRNFNCTASLGSDFCYLSNYNLIYYSLSSTSNDDTFYNFINSNFSNTNIDIFIWSLLHEIGHKITENRFNDKEWEEYNHFISHWNEKKLSDDVYYNLPIEYAATSWAANYIKDHTEEIITLWENISNIIAEINQL